MDRNTALGLTLIAAILLIYFYWFAPKPEAPAPGNSQSETAIADTLGRMPSQPDKTESDTAETAQGSFTPYIKAEEKLISVENEKLRITFSSQGARIVNLVLKDYQTYYKQPLQLIDPKFFKQSLTASIGENEVDLFQLPYTLTTSRASEGTVVTGALTLPDGKELRQVYTIPADGYEIDYKISLPGADQVIRNNLLTLQWTVALPPVEKDLHDTKYNTTITWYSHQHGFDELSQRSSDTEHQTFSDSIKWIALKEKFFLSSIIAGKGFTGGEVQTSLNDADTSAVKHAMARLFIPAVHLASGAGFTLYFGPNDYKTLSRVTPAFIENVYLGWPPVKWVNKYFILPVFYFLTNTVGNFGLVIIILVVIVRIILLPLSYKSYKSMAKMRVLKPELDELKARIGDDAQKVQQEQLKLYQQVGVNPLSGCVPVLLQMPILFAMFYLFPNNIDLRQESFLWADDLSTYDSIMHLPFSIPFYGNHVSLFTLLMTISTLVYTWQNNQISSVQGPMKSMSYIMPVIFLFVLNSFPAGLSFYYFISNLITFGQQAIIKRFVDEDKIKRVMEDNRKRNAGGGKKSRFMAKLEDAMKASEEARKKAKR